MDSSEQGWAAYQDKLKAVIEEGDEEAGVVLARTALDTGAKPLDFINNVIRPVMKDLGDEFARLERFLPDLMSAALVVKAIQSQVLEPAILKDGTQTISQGTIIIGTCQGDIHDIGKSMVALMLQVNGFRVVDLGTSVTPQAFQETAHRENADMIAMSSLLTPSLPYMKDLVKRLEGYGERERFLVIAGGAAVSREWANLAGLDGYGADAVEALALCQELIGRRKEVAA